MRHPLWSLLLLPLVGLVACGDDSATPAPEAAGTLPPAEITAPPETGPPVAPRYDLPAAGDDVVISVVNEGGLAPAGTGFARTPLALISGDGRAITTGAVPAIYPGPLLPSLLERSISPAAVQQLVAKADDLRLLRDVTYSRNDNVADATDTVVEITVDGHTYRHQAYALGIEGGEQDPDRQHLLEFVEALQNLPATIGGAALGPEQPFSSDHFLVQASPIDLATVGTEVEPKVVPWPAAAPVRLADAGECAVLPAAVAAPLFTDANSATYFSEGGATYAVAAVPQLPGRSC